MAQSKQDAKGQLFEEPTAVPVVRLPLDVRQPRQALRFDAFRSGTSKDRTGYAVSCASGRT
jgi:hypothetical protein